MIDLLVPCKFPCGHNVQVGSLHGVQPSLLYGREGWAGLWGRDLLESCFSLEFIYFFYGQTNSGVEETYQSQTHKTACVSLNNLLVTTCDSIECLYIYFFNFLYIYICTYIYIFLYSLKYFISLAYVILFKFSFPPLNWIHLFPRSPCFSPVVWILALIQIQGLQDTLLD